jgi:hypothetical protein
MVILIYKSPNHDDEGDIAMGLKFAESRGLVFKKS